eukprot:SAG11_NODE_25_length_23789_cov_23.813592_15_plen_85_part_00
MLIIRVGILRLSTLSLHLATAVLCKLTNAFTFEEIASHARHVATSACSACEMSKAIVRAAPVASFQHATCREEHPRVSKTLESN